MQSKTCKEQKSIHEKNALSDFLSKQNLPLTLNRYSQLTTFNSDPIHIRNESILYSVICCVNEIIWNDEILSKVHYSQVWCLVLVLSALGGKSRRVSYLRPFCATQRGQSQTGSHEIMCQKRKQQQTKPAWCVCWSWAAREIPSLIPVVMSLMVSICCKRGFFKERGYLYLPVDIRIRFRKQLGIILVK